MFSQTERWRGLLLFGDLTGEWIASIPGRLSGSADARARIRRRTTSGGLQALLSTRAYGRRGVVQLQQTEIVLPQGDVGYLCLIAPDVPESGVVQIAKDLPLVIRSSVRYTSMSLSLDAKKSVPRQYPFRVGHSGTQHRTSSCSGPRKRQRDEFGSRR